MNKKKILVILPFVSVVIGGGIGALSFRNDINFNLSATDDTIWKHYKAVNPSEFSHGSKEFWASCSEPGTHVFTEPTTGTIESGGAFDSTPYFEQLDIFDDRYVAPTTFGQIDGRDWDGVFGDYFILLNSNLTIESTQYIKGELNPKKQTSAFDSGKMSIYKHETAETIYAYHEYNEGYYVHLWNPNSSEYETSQITTSPNVYLSSYNIYRSFNASDFDYSSEERIYKLREQVAIESDSATQIYCNKCYIGFVNGQIEEIMFTLTNGTNEIKTIRDQYGKYGETTVTLPSDPNQ